jgi:hypothetical protein
MSDIDRSEPDAASIHEYIVQTFPGVDVVAIEGATFYSLDAEKHFPNFATIVTTDDFDEGTPSNLMARADVFRLNIGVSRETFDRHVGSPVAPQFDELDRLLPHPVYARQHWLSILNPSRETFETVIKALLAEAHERLAAARARHRLQT